MQPFGDSCNGKLRIGKVAFYLDKQLLIDQRFRGHSVSTAAYLIQIVGRDVQGIRIETDRSFPKRMFRHKRP